MLNGILVDGNHKSIEVIENLPVFLQAVQLMRSRLFVVMVLYIVHVPLLSQGHMHT